MSCPYLAEVTMVFCRASPVRKFIPSDRVSTASHCDGDAYGTCPLFVEALSRAGQTVRELEEETQCSRCSNAASASEGVKGGQS